MLWIWFSLGRISCEWRVVINIWGADSAKLCKKWFDFGRIVVKKRQKCTKDMKKWPKKYFF